MVLWFPAYGDLEGGYVVRADGGGIAAVRPPPPFSQAAAAAAGPSGGKFGRCRSIWRLQVYLAASLATAGPFGGKFCHCRAVWRQVLAAAGLLQGRYTRPSFNDAAAVEYSLCYLQVMLLLF